MKRITTTALAALTMLGFAADPGWAQPHGRPHHDMHDAANHDERLAKFAEAIGLSDAQKASVKKIHTEAGVAAKPLHDQAGALHAEIDQLLEAAKPDPTAIGNKMIAMHGVHKQLSALHERTRTKVLALLTPAQKTQFEKQHAARPHGH